MSKTTLAVSRSLSRTRQALPLSGSMTRQPSLKSKRRPSGPACVGTVDGGGSRGFVGRSAASLRTPGCASVGGIATVGTIVGSEVREKFATFMRESRMQSASVANVVADRGSSGLLLHEGAAPLIQDRLHQITEHRAAAGLHIHLGLHAWHQVGAAQPLPLFIGQGDPDGVE